MIPDGKISSRVDELQRQGIYAFHRLDLPTSSNQAVGSVRQSLSRMAKKGRVRHIRNGLYVILPVEYSAVGMIPYDWFIDRLMEHLGLSYYVALQSAAQLFGAAHQQVQQVQVIVPVQEAAINVPSLSIRFFRKKHFAATPTQPQKGHSGSFPVSTPEATAFDLVRYARQIGGLDGVSTILGELAERMEPTRLREAARAEVEIAPIQRLGWLLDLVGATSLSDELHQALPRGKEPARIRLDPGESWGGNSAQNRWKVVPNVTPEPDR